MEGNITSPYPCGFRFRPTDEELIVYYLQNKVDRKELPADVVREANLYEKKPEDVVVGFADPFNIAGENEWYFFTPRDRKYPNGNRPNRRAGVGYWKATGADKVIKDVNGSDVGLKKSLVYYLGDAPKGNKTNWYMHEYRLKESTSPAPSRGLAKSKPRSRENMRLDDWVLCRIYTTPSNAEKASATSRRRVSSAPMEPPTEDGSKHNEMERRELPSQESEPVHSEIHEDNCGNFTTDPFGDYSFMPPLELTETQSSPVLYHNNQLRNSQFYHEPTEMPQNLTDPKYETQSNPVLYHDNQLRNSQFRESKPEVHHGPAHQKCGIQMIPTPGLDQIVQDDHTPYHQGMHRGNVVHDDHIPYHQGMLMGNVVHDNHIPHQGMHRGHLLHDDHTSYHQVKHRGNDVHNDHIPHHQGIHHDHIPSHQDLHSDNDKSGLSNLEFSYYHPYRRPFNGKR